MKPYYEHAGITIYHGDCREVLPTLGPVDAVITDPPYGAEHTHAKHLSTVSAHQGLGFDGINEAEAVALASQWVNLARRWVVFTSEWHFLSAMAKADLLVRFGIWRKPDGALRRRRGC